MAICRGCGAQIVWIKTAGGKAMPCDPEPVAYKQATLGRLKIVTQNGEVLSGDREADPDQATGLGYISHFATCPAADNFRRR